MRLFVNLATGPENPTRAALAFLVARTAAEEGHEVRIFLAGDAVHLARPETAEAPRGIGTGSVAEHWEALTEAGVPVALSGCRARLGASLPRRAPASSSRSPPGSSRSPSGPRRHSSTSYGAGVSAVTTAHSSGDSIVAGSSRSARAMPAAKVWSSRSRSVEM